MGWRRSDDGHIYMRVGLCVSLHHSPVHDVGQQVVVPQPVLRVNLLVVHRQGAVQDTPFLRGQETSSYMPFMRRPTYIFLDRMGSELASRHIENLLPDPAALCEGGEGEVVGVDLAQT